MQPATRPAARSVPKGKEFVFEIKWDKISKDTLDNLSKAEQEKKMAAPGDISSMKLGVAKQLAPAWQDHRARFPDAKKCPSKEDTAAITDVIFEKFQYCLQIQINNVVISDGKSAFLRALGICVENLSRAYYQKSTSGSAPKKAKVGRGTVGVLAKEYNPRLAEAAQSEQEGIKEYLKNLHSTGFWDWDEVEENLRNTYELQRLDILNARETVERATEDDEDFGLEERAMSVLKKDWPFLFEVKGTIIHHNRLTGRDIEANLTRFINEDLNLFIMFLTTLSVKNMKIKAKVDMMNIPVGRKVLTAVEMLTIHFKEKFSNIVLTAEVILQYKLIIFKSRAGKQ